MIEFYPSDFAKVAPFDSALQNSECETVARNIMAILSKTGNAWRELDWDEYEAYRKKDSKLCDHKHIIKETMYFDKVAQYTTHWRAAILFCQAWKKITEEKC